MSSTYAPIPPNTASSRSIPRSLPLAIAVSLLTTLFLTVVPHSKVLGQTTDLYKGTLNKLGFYPPILPPNQQPGYQYPGPVPQGTSASHTSKCDIFPSTSNSCNGYYSIPAVYYDKNAQQCVKFTWSGCGSQPFFSEEECEKAGCRASGDDQKEVANTMDMKVKAVGSERCELKPEMGPCRAFIPKFFWDRKLGECNEFIWGGCQGVVPFNSMIECRRARCGSKDM